MIMSKVLVLYYSSYGHVEAMANAVSEGARQTGAHVDIKRVPELVPEEIARKSHFKLDQAAPIAKIDDLAAYDAIIIGTGTRFGRLSSQMANFLDQAGGLWMRGALHGKVGGAFTSTATQHGGQETTLFSIITNLLHFGMVVVGLDYGHAGQMTLDEITAGLRTVPQRLPVVMARGCRPRTSWSEHATRAARSRRSRTSCAVDAARVDARPQKRSKESQAWVRRKSRRALAWLSYPSEQLVLSRLT